MVLEPHTTLILQWLSNIFFYGYVGLLILAGGWGTVFGHLDQELLFNLKTDRLDPIVAASVLSQYRFLRAIEFGFGMISFIFRKDIFAQRVFNKLFLATMLLGVIARVISLVTDGSPNRLFYFFAISELIGVSVIFLYSRTTLEPA